jgi:hypothetical protein
MLEGYESAIPTSNGALGFQGAKSMLSQELVRESTVKDPCVPEQTAVSVKEPLFDRAATTRTAVQHGRFLVQAEAGKRARS